MFGEKIGYTSLLHGCAIAGIYLFYQFSVGKALERASESSPRSSSVCEITIKLSCCRSSRLPTNTLDAVGANARLDCAYLFWVSLPSSAVCLAFKNSKVSITSRSKSTGQLIFECHEYSIPSSFHRLCWIDHEF